MNVFNAWIDDRFIARELRLSGKIVTKGPLRVGAGREAVSLGSPVGLPILRRAGSGEPYIPGTSLKGVFRSTGERLARMKNLSVCSGLSGQTCADKEYQGVALLRWLDRMRRKARGVTEKYEEIFREIIEVVFRETCLMCKLFGAPSMGGRVFFFDADPVSPDSYRISSRKGIAISRYTGSVSGGALYEVEYVEPGSAFTFNLLARNLPNYAVGLLGKVIGEINQGRVRIGGFKTRGFGQVYIELERLEISVYDGLSGAMKPLDEFDAEVEVEPGSYAGEQNVWNILRRFVEVWDNASFAGRKA